MLTESAMMPTLTGVFVSWRAKYPGASTLTSEKPIRPSE